MANDDYLRAMMQFYGETNQTYCLSDAEIIALSILLMAFGKTKKDFDVWLKTDSKAAEELAKLKQEVSNDNGRDT